MAADQAELDRKINAVLEEADRMFIATAVDGNASGASVFFARQGTDLIFFTFHPTRKAEQIRFNPRVQCVVWPKGQEGIRGVQIDGMCTAIIDPDEAARARELVLAVTRAFETYMDDPFLIKNRVVGYYRVRPVTTKYVDFHAPAQFEWREYPEHRITLLGDALGAWKRRLLLWLRATRSPFFTAALVPVWPWPAPLLASIPVAIFVMLIVWINQFQDAPSDSRAGKRTWVVRLADQGEPVFAYERPFRAYALFNLLSFGFIVLVGLLGFFRPELGNPFALLALLPALLTLAALRCGRAWLAGWNRPGADRQRLPYELLKVNVTTIGVHFLTGLLLVLGYWLQGRFS